MCPHLSVEDDLNRGLTLSQERACAGDRVAAVMNQAPYAAERLDVGAPINAVAALALLRSHLRELCLPVADHARPHAHEPRDLADLEVQAVR
jgi:hypothetical protein